MTGEVCQRRGGNRKAFSNAISLSRGVFGASTQRPHLSTLVSASLLFMIASAPTPPEKPFWRVLEPDGRGCPLAVSDSCFCMIARNPPSVRLALVDDLRVDGGVAGAGVGVEVSWHHHVPTVVAEGAPSWRALGAAAATRRVCQPSQDPVQHLLDDDGDDVEEGVDAADPREDAQEVGELVQLALSLVAQPLPAHQVPEPDRAKGYEAEVERVSVAPPLH
ncbi:hypothetical protein JZ751_004820 [Albula glossodonta]|uniref:Uncharacterized protein n=1 Tax=Albula glossodonta TaxID=121402 RepID=A0A8T2P1I2_9TELE|nr:hypothetical protein JZ751_004820 [Albula glossodonta]